MAEPLVGVVMGSKSDWEIMQHAVRRLREFGVPCQPGGAVGRLPALFRLDQRRQDFAEPILAPRNVAKAGRHRSLLRVGPQVLPRRRRRTR